MPWRKYITKKTKFGPSYYITKGIWVRRDHRGKWVLFIDKNGIRKNKTIGTGRDGLVKAIKAAETIAIKIDSIRLNQTDEKSNHILSSFKQCSKNWLEGNAGCWDELTYERYEQILRIHIWPNPVFKKRLDKIGRKEIKKHLRNVYKKRSPATVEAVHAVISGVFNEAIDDEILDANPASGLLKRILPPKRQRDVKDPDPFTRKELDTFLTQSEKTCSLAEQLILKVMAYAGLRLGESLSMRVENLYPERMLYRVSQSFKRKRFKKPKGDQPRFVDFPDFLVEELKNYLIHLRKENLKKGKGKMVDLFFIDPDENGPWPYSQRKIQGLVRRVCKAAGLRIRNPHDLRHTYATILLMAHQSPGYVQKQLGHSSIQITMDIYCHWIPGEGRKGLEDALMGTENVVPNLVRQPHIIAYNKKRSQ